MQHGRGSKAWMTKSFEYDRQHALEKRSNYTDEELEELEITDISQGGGKTNQDTYEFYQFPFPMDPTIRQRKKIDLREADPTIGGK